MNTKRETLVLGLGNGGTSMHRAMKTVLPTVLVLAALAAGCAQDMGTVDRTQQNITKKTDLLFNADGTRKEFFVKMTTIEAPYASAYSFVGYEGTMERGVFDIQENVLYFYRVYPFVTGEWADTPRHDVDQKLTNQDGSDYLVNGQEVWMDKNAPVLAYPVSSHMDIIWEYNANTGEKTNVKSENTSDRLWHEREYMRVSWGTNLSNSATSMFFGNTSSTPTILLDQQAAADLESRITPADGYMDFVNDYVMGAQTEYLEGYGTVPLCWFYPWYAGGVYECISEKVRTRTSFLVVDPAREAQFHQWDRLDYNDHDMERFGYFRSERLRWDIDYGTTFGGIQRYANRHDIWQRDENGAIIGVKPIVYHLTEGYPANLVQASIDMAAQWSVAFDATVKSVTGKDPIEFPAYDRNGKPMGTSVEHMFLVCENNDTEAAAHTAVTALTDPAICGDMSQPKYLGDLRYNFVSSVNAPTQVGLYGYGPSSADPLSGRIVSATANVYVAAMHEGAQRAMDRIELLAGIKSFREVADAKYIADDVRAERLKQSTYWKSGFTNEEADAVVSKLVAPEVQSSLTASAPVRTDQNFSASRMAILASNPGIENMFVSDDIRLLFRDPRLGSLAEDLQDDRSQSYLLRNWAHVNGTRQKIKAAMEQTKKGMDMASYYDGAVLRLADEYKLRYDQYVCGELSGTGSPALDFSVFNDSNPCSVEALIDQLRVKFAYAEALNPYGLNMTYIPTPLEMPTHNQDLLAIQKTFNAVLENFRTQVKEEMLEKIFYGVVIHEVGHTVGLRHNFEASTDALNFKPGYWDLKVRKEGDTYQPVGLWAETSEQARAGMREYQYSSVMEYCAKFNMPWMGLGLYDVAAIKYAYGNLVEVFDTAPNLDPFKAYIEVDPMDIAPGNEFASLRDDRGEGLGLALRRIHASNIPNLWGDTARIYARHDVPKSEVIGQVCTNEGAACGDGKVCRRLYEGLRCSIQDTVVPYRFGSDEMAWMLPTVTTNDEGVDPYEIVANQRELYENTWVFSGYWHNDPTYWPTYYDNTVRWVFYNMRSQFQWWALNYQVYNHDDFWLKKFGKRWEEDLNGGKPGALAAYTSFNTMAGAFGRPEAGTYGKNRLTGRFEPVDEVNRNNYNPTVVFLEEAGARPIYSNWDYSGYQPVVVSSGSIYERIAAFEYLSDPETWFLATDDQADTRKFLINYASVFRNEMRELFGGLMANNSQKYGWCVLTHPQTQQPVTFVQPDRVGSAFDGQDCGTMFQGCFVKDGNGSYAKTPVSLLRYDQPAECPSGTEKVALAGLSIEPEPLYTFPTTRFRIPMLAAYYGMAFLVGNYDMSFMDMSRLWLQGEKYAVTPPPGAEIAQCEDVFSGRVYTTYRLNDGAYYPAYDLVKQCDFMFSCYDPARNKTLTADEELFCKSIAVSMKDVPDLTFDDLRVNYLFHPLQFLVGKLELIRSMHASFEYGE